MSDVDVAIVGAGPTGLALACELRLAGVSCRVLERRTEEPNLTRAFAVHARTLELLDARGMAEGLVERGVKVGSVNPTPGAVLDLTALRTRYPMVLIVAQSRTEKMLEQRARELGAEIVRGAEVSALEQDADGVRLDLADGSSLRAKYVVGTDGSHSTIRRLIGVDFVGTQYETHIMLADVQLERPPAETLFGATTQDGLVLFVPFGDSWFRAIAWDRRRETVPLEEPITVGEIRDAFQSIAGDDYGMGEPRWSTRFLSERRQARTYRVGRVFLAGDAAHVHSPVGGQGMNTGIQDAMNLGWKLAAAVHGWAAPDLLDSYEKERHPVGEQVLKLTDALYKLVMSRSKLGAAARRAAIRTLLRFGRVRQVLGGRLSGIGIKYDRPSGSHRWTGRRVPDTADPASHAVYEALREGKFVLTGAEVASDRVVSLPGTRPPGLPAVVLVRPDGYVAWATDGAGRGRDASSEPARPQDRSDAAEIRAAVEQWCGPLHVSSR
jgi:2-polyprenyl-6-methoxyphenol hydroxylase-like FAD-dependent oxidoreductase